MAGGLRLFLLALVALPTAAALAQGDGEDEPAVQPQLERRDISEAAIDTENIEVGAFAGMLSIEDFGSNAVYGGRLAYHVTEDFFAEATYGLSRAGKTSFETLSGSAQLLTDSERDYSYYSLSMGWNALPGEAFWSSDRAFTSTFYLLLGVGATDFGGDNRFTTSFGAGYRVLPTDWVSVRVEARDHVFDSDILGESKTTHNLEFSTTLSVFF
ncbi:MAG: outer membrane beta-barrel domain-containing protein [Ectothiorhodospiraceae bacterium]|jgi:outer membrane beta-barrel protein